MFNWIKEKERVFMWMPTLIWASVILFFAVLPYRGFPALTVGYFDKIAHFFEFTVLAVLIIWGLYHDLQNRFRERTLLFTLLLGVGYGIVLELVQRFIPGRDPNLADAVSNAAGVLFGVVLGKALIWRK